MDILDSNFKVTCKLLITLCAHDAGCRPSPFQVLLIPPPPLDQIPDSTFIERLFRQTDR